MAATPEAMTQMIVQLGNDLKAALAKISDLEVKIVKMETSGGMTHDDLRQKEALPGGVQARHGLARMER